ncbi:Vacuolar amino acid transporter 5 [Durusdinium trenchii]|uniref:Vacuolar amino acid transporter 5 n=1 Tax=Durusdinium trenchii TaxID=1381693 RepID=A0ABP0HPX9_9DINO
MFLFASSAPRKLQRKGSFRRGGVIPTAICLSKAAIGAGVLSVSGHAAEVGVVVEFEWLRFGGLLTVMSIRMISVASIETKKWGFEDVSEELFHPVMSLFTGFMNVCNCLGAAAGYLIVCGQVFVVVFQANRSARDLFVVLVGIFVCCPMALARHVGFMRHLALLSIVALIFVVVVVAWYWGDQGTDESVTVENFLLGAGGATPIIYMNAINNMIFAFCNQFNVPQLTGELTPEPSRQGMTKVAVLSTSASFFLYASVSIVGVLAFGVGGNQKDSLILDLMPVRKEVHVLISLLAVMFSVLTCFQFHIYPIRQFLAYVVRKARGRSSDDEEKDVVYFGLSLTRWYDIVCALGTVCLVVLIAVVITSLRTIMDFIGAFASAYISFIVPPLWIIALRRKDPKNFSWFSREILFSVSFLALGLFLFVFGTYSAILPILGH